jgi:DNA-binding transcriptional ArsR family regulator
MQALDDRAIGQVADYFRALGEPLRLKLLNALRGGPRNVGELTQTLGCSQANVSKHLANLAKLGFVEREASGTSVYYRIADPRIFQLCDLVCGQIAGRLFDQAQMMSAYVVPSVTNPQAGARPAVGKSVRQSRQSRQTKKVGI